MLENYRFLLFSLSYKIQKSQLLQDFSLKQLTNSDLQIFLTTLLVHTSTGKGPFSA
jgi:hypothetical protein